MENMRDSWGRIVLLLLATVFFLSGCSGSNGGQLVGDVLQTFSQDLAPDLGQVVDRVELGWELGAFTYTDSTQRRLDITFSGSPEQAERLKESTVEWGIVDRVLCLEVRDSAGEAVDTQELSMDFKLSYPANELPAALKLQLEAGQIKLSGYRGNLDVVVADGTCSLEEVTLTGASRVEAGGWINADILGLSPGIHKLAAGFGFLEVHLPAELAARIIAQTEMGTIINSLTFSYLEPTITDGIGAALSGWLDAGGAELQLYCGNGDIILRPR